MSFLIDIGDADGILHIELMTELLEKYENTLLELRIVKMLQNYESKKNKQVKVWKIDELNVRMDLNCRTSIKGKCDCH